MESRIVTYEEHKQLENRITELEKDKRVSEYQYKQIMETLKEVQADVKDLKTVPSKRWDLIITSGITAVVGGLIAFILTNIM